jgi:uncharacterized DUF497 family protein
MDPNDIFSLIEGCDGFEWDTGNLFKAWMGHKVLPHECHEAFANEPKLAGSDKAHSGSEPRFLFYGRTNQNRLLTMYSLYGGTKFV